MKRVDKATYNRFMLMVKAAGYASRVWAVDEGVTRARDGG